MGADRTGLNEKLETLLEDLIGTNGISHALLVVESTDVSFRWAGSVGPAQLQGPPMTEESPYFIASVDKLMTSAIILKLSEEGRLDLGDTALTHLPPSVVRSLHIINGRDHTEEITIRHLLSHTSGLADYLEDRPKAGRSLIEKLTEEGDRSWSLEEALRLVREDLEPHFEPQPLHAKNPRIRYSDTNFILLNAIIERVTGLPLHEAFHSVVFDPLKLEHTWMPGHSLPSKGTPEPSVLWFGNKPLKLPLAMKAFPAIYSTASDQLRFLRALVQGEFFVQPRTFSLMQETWNRFGFPLDAAALRAPSWPIDYGMGLMRFRLPFWLNRLRPMSELIGHSGSTGTWLFYSPELKLMFAGTVDQATAGHIPFRFLPKVVRSLQHSRPSR